MAILELRREFGLVILTAVVNWLVLMWQVMQVGKARTKFEVKYPTLYENKYPSEFNCIQRAHQSSLEWNTSFLLFLFVAGWSAPLSASLAGMIYNVGRYFHAKGYYEGSAHKGLWGLFALFYLVGASAYTGVCILRHDS